MGESGAGIDRHTCHPWGDAEPVCDLANFQDYFRQRQRHQRGGQPSRRPAHVGRTWAATYLNGSMTGIVRIITPTAENNPPARDRHVQGGNAGPGSTLVEPGRIPKLRNVEDEEWARLAVPTGQVD